MNFYDIKNSTLNLMQSYLGGREQTACVNEVFSQYRASTVDSNVIRYADNTTLYSASDKLFSHMDKFLLLDRGTNMSLKEVSVWFRAH